MAAELEKVEEEIKPWDRQEGETDQSFYAFTVYRDLNPFERTLENVTKALQKSIQKGSFRVIAGWSAKYGWVERAKAWDAYCDSKMRDRRLQKWEEVQNKIFDYAQALLEKGAERALTIKEDEVPAMTLSKWLTDAQKVMHDLRGEPSEVKEYRHQIRIRDFWGGLFEEEDEGQEDEDFEEMHHLGKGQDFDDDE